MAPKSGRHSLNFLPSYSYPDLRLELYFHCQDVTPAFDCTFLVMDVWRHDPKDRKFQFHLSLRAIIFIYPDIIRIIGRIWSNDCNTASPLTFSPQISSWSLLDYENKAEGTCTWHLESCMGHKKIMHWGVQCRNRQWDVLCEVTRVCIRCASRTPPSQTLRLSSKKKSCLRPWCSAHSCI